MNREVKRLIQNELGENVKSKKKQLLKKKFYNCNISKVGTAGKITFCGKMNTVPFSQLEKLYNFHKYNYEMD
ncbi:hypothetical protein T01_14330 [Trichinella spiralis]|uniref:Uncharacterized protein n=1 Tax=Trichinella spiralis TaxID=6334 RepID=A0A0V1AQG2_TRISP|nr:hypothetical protein T01_14330 [Trichinella spiralis]